MARSKVTNPPKKQPAKAPAPHKETHRREVVLLTAAQWVKRLDAHARLTAKEQEEFDAKKRFEISLTEDRKQALAMIAERYGPGEAGWRRAEAQHGCSWWTYKTWADDARNVQPRDQSFKRTAIALGIKHGFYR
jgi:hypothetical protein